MFNPLVSYLFLSQMVYLVMLNTAHLLEFVILVNSVLVVVIRNTLSNLEKSIYINSLYTIEEVIYIRNFNNSNKRIIISKDLS